MPNSGSIVAVVFGSIFVMGGLWAAVVYEQCAALFGGGFGSICATEETAVFFSLGLGILLIIIGALTWHRKPRSRRRKAAAGGD